jgi:SNF2 family DNA or RNA helicase
MWCGAYTVFEPNLPPYEHQKRAVDAAVRGILDDGYHALFMEMGTGKTKTTIDAWRALLTMGDFNALLVVAPKAILSVWSDEEIPRHGPSDYGLYVWDGRTSAKAAAQFESVLRSSRPAILLVNVEAFQTVPDAMRDMVRRFLKDRTALMVVDESSTIKSPDAKRAKNIVLAGKLAAGRMILTGTEITNSVLDLYMQFEFLKPGFWEVRNYFLFRARYAILEDAYGAGRRTFKKVVGFQRVGELMDRITPYCSRALKRDCLDLPPKIYMTIRVELSEPQKAAYKSLKDHLAALIEGKVLTVPNKIALFTKFRQITGGMVCMEGEKAVIDPHPPKLAALIADVEDSSEQAIVWASFTHEIDMVAAALSKVAKTVKFYGEEEQAARDEAKRLFQSGEARFIVMNPQCGAYGLNFQNAHIQYFYSRSLRPADNWQGEDRIHRSGQTETCVYKTLLARDTVDERIETLLAAKTDVRSKIQDMTIEDMFSII